MKGARWQDGRQASAPLWLGNLALGMAPRRRWTAGQLIDAARRSTGLHHLGPEFFVPALERLVTSIHEEACLHPIGRLIQKKRLTDLLANRLRIEAQFAATPELDEVELLPPLLIAGLQRSGTTLLHRLLASHPMVRALPSWEALTPGALPLDPDDAKRRAIARKAEKGLRFIAPDFFAIHPVEATAPEEEVLLLELSFMSQTGEAIMHVPSYAQWLEEQDQTPAYEYMVRVLKVLQRRTPSRRAWVLKSPNHLEWLDVVRRTMPGVVVLQTHRNPLSTVPSFCSMVAHGRAVFSSQVDSDEVGAHWLRKIGRLLERTRKVRSEADSNGFIDLDYETLVDDPIAAVEGLFESLGWSSDEVVSSALRAELARNTKDRFGKHRYILEDFGLSEARVREVLYPYMVARGY